MSWLFSRALAEEYSDRVSSDGGLYARLKSTPTARAFLSSDKTTEFSKPFRYGTTCEPLTENLGEELLTSFRLDFLVNRSPSQDVTKERETIATYGPKRFESFAKFDRDSGSWKTSQISLLTNTLERFSENFPRAGMIRDGIAYLRPPLVRLTKGIASGLLPTPTATEYGTSQNEGKVPHKRPSRGTPSLFTMARKNLWPTPTVKGNHNKKELSDKAGDGLETAVKRWPTPRAQSATGPRRSPRAGKEGIDLQTAVQLFPTPSATDWKGAGKKGELRDRLDYAVERGSTKSKKYDRPPDGGQLNPTWVEWLMGWPLEWTDLKPLAMDKFRSWLNMFGTY